MNDNSIKYVVVGQFGAPHGVSGAIKVNSDTDPADAILNYHPWYVDLHHSWQILDLAEAKQQGTNLLAFIKNISDRDEVKQFTGHKIAVRRDQLPALPKGEYYWIDLEGLEVINEEGIVLGKVDYLFSAGSAGVMVVQGSKKHLIPFLQEEYILDVNLDTRVIKVHWDPDF